ncbi:limulus clotting factor C-like [Thrips palmi]|uniref:Limulus clotting factor C-like n=1 Tax=Thrips palmi TaxID=161013 RepID=A0A6P8Y679_THRPL|nr:limulus clotting factor C-like [Thrips palmi]
MACAAICVLVFIYVLCCVVRPSSPAAMCPPLHSDTVQVQCLQGSEPFNCTALSSPPGTLAKFQCRALHQPLFGFPPPAGFESSCGSNGEWSVRPFRCVPICGRPTGRPSALVRDGEVVTSAADYPWHVTVYDLTLDLKQICGGSLVTTKFFISGNSESDAPLQCTHNSRLTL